MNTAGTSCSTTSPTATTSLYSYDGEGHRATSSTNGVTNAFIWDTGASQLLADSTHDYVYLQGSVTPDLQINLTTGTVDLLIQDQNANTRGVAQVTGATSALNGTIVNYTDYDAYGNAITQSGGSVNPGALSNGGVSTDISTSFAFGAGYLDASNLTYLVHRYLDNETGQFISVDPLVDQTRQAYVYAGDGPIANFDRYGTQYILANNSSCTHVEQLQWKARLCVQVDTFPTFVTNELSKPQEYWQVDSGRIASIGAQRIGMEVCGSHGTYPGHPRNCKEDADTTANVATSCGTNVCTLDGPMYVSSEVNWEAAWVYSAWIQWDGGPKLTKKVSLHETPLCRLGNGGSHACETNWRGK